ncbi:MAG: prepilin-type N-terminal cleavage/methylation domain-containing protein [Nitrospirae bacterium]|nr:prepilin-type N-terminal cleavage/methylation domain-containing protein [Nitrospirota bacterium]
MIYRAGIWNKINKRHRHRSSGYTLIELSVVLLILGLILSIFLPRLTGIAGGDLKTTSRKIIGIIQYTYDEAIGRRQVHRLNYDIREGLLWVTIMKEDGEFVEADPNLFQKIFLPRNVLFKDVKTLHSGTVTDGKTFTQFFPAGRVEKTTLHLVSNKNEETTLVINPLTGRVKVYDGYIDLR